MNPFMNKKVILGITGSIAAYKAAEIASTLTKQGAIVSPVLTPAGEKFIAPLTLHSVTGRHASVDRDLWEGDQHVTHIELGHHADLIVVAPASADFIGKMVQGLGDSLLALTVLASHCPILIAPAMDGDMYANAATQHNISVLRERGVQLIGPESGHLASGLVGKGRMSEPATIVGAIRYALSRGNPLSGKRVLVTAGGTQEEIDPVRVITNRSSGKQGYALAQAALDAGADVTLISAPSAVPVPAGCEIVQVKSADQMNQAVLEHISAANILIMTAAVADFKPAAPSSEKIKKSTGIQPIELVPTVDILAGVGAQRDNFPKLKIVAGFAAESQSLRENAAEKLQKKNLDLIIANDISRKEIGFESDSNQVTLLFRDGNSKELPLASKAAVSEAVLDEIIHLLQ